MTDEAKTQLDHDGFVILPDFMAPDLQTSLLQQVDKLFEIEGDRAGAEFKQEPGCRRLANLVNKGAIFQQVIGDTHLLSLVRHVLGPKFKLSSLNARSVDAHADVTQPLHADMGIVPDEWGNRVCNSVWMLGDVNEDNGPMRVLPGSHRSGRLPQEHLDDLQAPHPNEVLVTGRAGTVVVMNAHLWHGGLPNQTDQPRTVIHAFFCRSDQPQQQYQKSLLDDDVQQSLSPALRELLALDDPYNDTISAAPAVRSGFLK